MVPEAAETASLIRGRRGSMKLGLDPGRCDAAHLSTDRDLPCRSRRLLDEKTPRRTLATLPTTWIQVHPTTLLQSKPTCQPELKLSQSPVVPVTSVGQATGGHFFLHRRSPAWNKISNGPSPGIGWARLGPHILTGFSRLRLTCLLLCRQLQGAWMVHSTS